MIFIFLLALIIFGPRKLPEIGQEIGKALAELKRASNEFKAQLENEIEQVNVEEERKKFHDKAQELMQETQNAFTIQPPAQSGVARSLGDAGVTAEDIQKPPSVPVESVQSIAPQDPLAGEKSELKAPNVQ